MKKTLGIISKVLTWILVVVVVAIMIFTIVSVRTFDNVNRDIFGYKAFIVRSDSMAATDFDAGDIVLVKEVDARTLEVGDIITFTSQNSANYGETVTHKIRSLTTNEDGDPAFVTYGTTTNVDDETPVAYDFILGKYQFAIPNVGSFFMFLKTTPGYVCCILIPFLLLFAFEALNCFKLFRQYKKEQMAEIEEEKAQLEEERRRSQAMMEELMALKRQMAEGGGQGAEPAQTPVKRQAPPASSAASGAQAQPVRRPAPIDPATGKPMVRKVPIDPATGQPIRRPAAPIDPATGKPAVRRVPIDPATGQPVRRPVTPGTAPVARPKPAAPAQSEASAPIQNETPADNSAVKQAPEAPAETVKNETNE